MLICGCGSLFYRGFGVYSKLEIAECKEFYNSNLFPAYLGGANKELSIFAINDA